MQFKGLFLARPRSQLAVRLRVRSKVMRLRESLLSRSHIQNEIHDRSQLGLNFASEMNCLNDFMATPCVLIYTELVGSGDLEGS